MSDSTRSKAIEAMARAIEHAHDIQMTDGVPRERRLQALGMASIALTAYESHLSAEGMTVVPVEPTDAMLDALHDKVWIRADPALRECSILNDRETYAAMLSASPYWKASMQEASAEREARSEQIPPGKEESK